MHCDINTIRGRLALTDDNFKSVADELEAQRKQPRAAISWFFVLFMAVLALVCLWLGFWQLDRLDQKRALIASVEDRISLDPVELPPAGEWVGFDPEAFDFRPVELNGSFIADTVLVFTSLSDANGPQGGAGYWVMTPFALEGGGTVIVNRGFIPQGAKNLFGGQNPASQPPAEPTNITGIARVSEQANAFTPGPDDAARIDYVRAIDRMSAMMDPALAPFAPLYVNQDAATPDTLPQGGETVISFPNRHFEYAMTWFAFAGVTFIMTLFWLWLQRRKA